MNNLETHAAFICSSRTVLAVSQPTAVQFCCTSAPCANEQNKHGEMFSFDVSLVFKGSDVMHRARVIYVYKGASNQTLFALTHKMSGAKIFVAILSIQFLSGKQETYYFQL